MRIAFLLALLAALGAVAHAEDPAYPTGRSTQEIEGLEVVLLIPPEIGPERPASMLLALHGNGGQAKNFAGAVAPWHAAGYVVVVPQSRHVGWEDAGDVAAVHRIAEHVLEQLPIDRRKVHVLGFSNGGWNLPGFAFSEALRPVSATWAAAGFRGASVPKWARTELGALFLVGRQDGNHDSAWQGAGLLEDDVRTVEVRVQENLGHAWPGQLTDYAVWWTGVQEGRFTPGDDRSFPWASDLPAAVAALEGERKGGVFVFIYGDGDEENEHARAFQREVLFDADVRFLGNQLQCVRLEATADAEAIEAAGIKVRETPTVAVLDREGRVKKTYDGKISPRRLASALRRLVPVPRPPER